MSIDPNHTRYLLGRYNFSRRVVDHRVPYDFHYSINAPVLSKPWLGRAKQRFIGSMIYYFGAYVAGGALVFSVIATYTDALYRINGDKGIKPSTLTQPTPTPVEKYIFHFDDRTRNLGKWNHNFGCFENEKNCGRDFDWVRKTNATENA